MLEAHALLAFTDEELDDLDSALADSQYVAEDSLDKDPIYRAETEAYLERIAALRTVVWEAMRELSKEKLSPSREIM